MHSPRIRRIAAFAALLFFLHSEAHACTLWAATGQGVAGGGTLIVKNRDWPEQAEATATVTPDAGFRYFALYALDARKDGTVKRRVVAGLNEAGLVVVSASASSIPQKQRQADKSNRLLMTQLLTGAKSVAEALDAQKFPPSLFYGPRFLLLADATETAWVEIGLGGKFSVRREKNGVLTHTNHFLAPAMLDFNIKIGDSSAKRHERIISLLRGGVKPYTLDYFTLLARDAAAGPDNSIFRTGSAPDKPRTLSVFAVSLPPQGAPEIRLWMKGQGTNDFITLQAADLFPPRRGTP